jgi:hypothetical protein
MMQTMFVRMSKMVLSVILLSIHMQSYGIAAYIPQALRECIAIIYEASDSNSCKSKLEELYSTIRENRMLGSDNVIRRGVKEALAIIRASHNKSAIKDDMVEYLEQYLKNLNDKAILLVMNGDVSHMRSWSPGLIDRCMQKERDAYDLLRLSNEISNNLVLCGSEANAVSLDSRVIKNFWSNQKPALNINSRPNQPSNPTMTIGSTGVNSAAITGWALTPGSPQSPVDIEFVIPDDFDNNKPVSLELGFLVPNNGLNNGYVNFLVQEKYVIPGHSFNIDNINWTHTNTSGNVKINEPVNPHNVRYMFINIPLSKSYIKPGYFALLSISRTSPTHECEYAGDLSLVSAAFKYNA